MTKTRKTIVAVVAAIAVLLIAAAAGLAVYSSAANSYSTQLSRGAKYLQDGDYENAVLCYQRAIEADPDQADGYIGLARTYIALDRLALARTVLNEGYERTGSARLQLMLQTYLDVPGSETASGETPADAVTASLALNTDLLNTIAGSTFNEYRLADMLDQETQGDGSYTAVDAETGVQLEFFNTEANGHVIDANTGRPYTSLRPNRVTFADLSVLFGGNDSVTLQQLTGLKLSNVRQQDDSTHGQVITFEYEGCQARIACDEDGTIHGGSWNEFLPAQEVGPEVEGNLTGRLVNAVTGAGVPNAEMEFRGQGLVQTVTTDASGNYAANLEPGTYTVTINCPGFVKEEIPVTVNQVDTVEELTISPLMAEGEIRIVLEWGGSPSDLDSYLMGETDNGEEVFTNFRNKTCTGTDGRVIARQDVDDTNGYGPETTTIYDINGTYEFFVLDFNHTGTIASSGATVKVYVGNEPPVTINICSDAENQWLVCNIDHGEVEIINIPQNRPTRGSTK